MRPISRGNLEAKGHRYISGQVWLRPYIKNIFTGVQWRCVRLVLHCPVRNLALAFCTSCNSSNAYIYSGHIQQDTVVITESQCICIWIKSETSHFIVTKTIIYFNWSKIICIICTVDQMREKWTSQHFLAHQRFSPSPCLFVVVVVFVVDL